MDQIEKIILTPMDPLLTNYTIVEENQSVYITGFVYGHNSHVDGTKISTSEIVKIIGKLAWTSSGSVYRLDVAPELYKNENQTQIK